jgi:hypothetical protein
MKQQYQKIINSGLQGSAVMGRTYAVIGSIITVILGIFIIIMGVYMNYNSRYIHIQAKITQSQCTEDISNSSYICNLSILYRYNNQSYEEKVKNYISNSIVETNDVLSIYIDQSNPSTFSLYRFPSWFSFLVILIGCCLVFFSLIYVFFIVRYKGLAVIAGLKTVLKN